MKKLILTLSLILCGATLTFLSAHADKTQNSPMPQFFSVLSDVPVMSGLVEMQDDAVVFDKPEGRIVEAYANMDGVTKEDVGIFYRATLPQFGWGLVEGNTYFRNGEYLELSFDEERGNKTVKFMIRPSR